MEAYTIIFLLAGVLTGLLFGIYIAERTKRKNYIRIWNDRSGVRVSTSKWFHTAKKSIFLYGLSFEETFTSHKGDLVKAFRPGVKINMLLLNPKSKHVAGHKEFSDRPIEKEIDKNINIKLKNIFFESLTEEQRAQLTVKATNFWPRFSAKIWDGSYMYVNFYLYRSSASDNPVILITAKNNPESFNKINGSLLRLFNDPDNIIIAQHGQWHGLKYFDPPQA